MTTAARKEQLIMTNITEYIVKQQVREAMKELNCCDCETCYFNACALALNALKSRYVTTVAGEILSEFTAAEANNKAEILVEVTKAVMKVKENPRH